MEVSDAKVMVTHIFSGAPDTSSGVKAIVSNDFRVAPWISQVQK